MLLAVLFLALPFTNAVALPTTHELHDRSDSVNKRLPGTWHHADDHHVHALFKRAPGDGEDYPAVGSPTWSSGFPSSTPDPSQLPQEWVDALNAAVAAGKIPNIPKSTNTPGVNPVYPAGVNPNSPEVCSATYKCRNPDDIWDAPTGYLGTSFDDGPLPTSTKLLQFLQDNNETATHFMIGVNIIQNPQQFQTIFDAGGDIAAHTWTHPYMTTLSNLEVLGQLGWTSELIRNSTGGRVPRFWRPPYGDSDNRVRAIAKEIFGLETIIWNQDTEDWSLATGGTTSAKVHASMEQWLSGPKSPGLIILEHESSDQSVQAFIDAYPLIKSNGWNTLSLASLVGEGQTYQNAQNSSSAVTLAGILVGQDPGPTSPIVSSSQVPLSQSSSLQPASSSQQGSQTPTGTGNSLASSDTPSNFALSLHGNMFWKGLYMISGSVVIFYFT